MYVPRPTYSFRISFLRSASKFVERDATLLGQGCIHGDKDRRRGVDGKVGGDIVEILIAAIGFKDGLKILQ
jgi:hypothetical protein